MKTRSGLMGKIKGFNAGELGSYVSSMNSIIVATPIVLPNKFKLDIAIDLMQLCIYTYDQYQNQNDDTWTIPKPYLIKKTFYVYETQNDNISKKKITNLQLNIANIITYIYCNTNHYNINRYLQYFINIKFSQTTRIITQTTKT